LINIKKPFYLGENNVGWVPLGSLTRHGSGAQGDAKFRIILAGVFLTSAHRR
jgi:hypothetical protein